MSRIKAWSYSRWETYDRCPFLAKCKFIDKIPEDENEAMQRGKAVHDEIAAYLRGDVPLYAPGMQLPVTGWAFFGELLDELRALEPLVEQQWGFTNQWLPTGWFSGDTWFRSVLDAAVVYGDNTADVVDMKTGKERSSHATQGELYAVSVFIRYPQVTHVAVRFWYLDSGAESVYRFARRDLAGLIEKWTQKVSPMLSDRRFVPRPGHHCTWCYVAKAKGGPCKYG